MAGAFTHIMIANAAKRHPAVTDPKLRKMLNKYAEFLWLGAVSPDLPYLSIPSGALNWADLMHYEKTNGIVISGHRELKRIWPAHGTEEEILLVWLLGFVSHLVADATIHPIVECIAGEYASHKPEHRTAEMTQDSLLFNAQNNGNDIRYAELSSVIQFCRKSPYFGDVMTFWKLHAQKVYPKNGEPDPRRWFTTYDKAIDAAEGDSGVVALFRHLGLAKSYIYRTTQEILVDYPLDFQKYYASVRLPNGLPGSFLKNGFDYALHNVIVAWNALFAGLSSNLQVATVVRNWNLDTGRDMGLPGMPVTYWA
ncbi:MAG TPA: zinc dependent phospholipase C family protein [Dissulfurispiraceae bacterium]|nr:zinc dependent phospholipase C family protein [Dissulfurispiraceae bacterium]